MNTPNGIFRLCEKSLQMDLCDTLESQTEYYANRSRKELCRNE